MKKTVATAVAVLSFNDGNTGGSTGGRGISRSGTGKSKKTGGSGKSKKHKSSDFDDDCDD